MHVTILFPDFFTGERQPCLSADPVRCRFPYRRRLWRHAICEGMYLYTITLLNVKFKRITRHAKILNMYQQAASNGQVQCLSVLLRAKADINRSGGVTSISLSVRLYAHHAPHLLAARIRVVQQHVL